MPVQERDDGELMALAREGDHGAYGQLVRRYQRAIVRHLTNLTGSRDEAVELAQDVFLKAWEAVAEWRPNSQVQPWLYRIASNLAFDLLRRRKTVRFEPIDDAHEGASSEPEPDRRLQDKQAIAGLQAALQRLPVELSEIILLREVEGLSYQDLSATLRIDEGTVKSRLARARAALVQRYEATNV